MTNNPELRDADGSDQILVDRKEWERLNAADFWGGLVYPEGATPEDIQNELTDYHFILHQVDKVYCHVTGGKLSKPNYPAETVISEADAHMEKQIEWAVADALENQPTPADILAVKPLVEAVKRADRCGRHFHLQSCSCWIVLDEALTQTEALATQSAAVWRVVASAIKVKTEADGVAKEGYQFESEDSAEWHEFEVCVSALPPEIIEMAKRVGGE